MGIDQHNALGYCGLADQFRHLDNEDKLLTAVIRWIGAQTSVDWAVVYPIDEQAKSIIFDPRYVWLRSGLPLHGSSPRALEVRDVGWNSGAVGRAARAKEGIVLNSGADFEAGAKDLFFDFGPSQSSAMLPLIAHGRTIAVMAAGRQNASFLPNDLILLGLAGTVASAHWIRQAAGRESGTLSKAFQKLTQGLSGAATSLRAFRKTYGRVDFLATLAKVPLALIRAQRCLILTYDPLTSGLFEERCYFWNDGTHQPVRGDDHVFVELVRSLRGKRYPLYESDLSHPRAGALREISQRDPFLSCLATQVTLDTERESFLLLFSWSRDAFGNLERAILDLVQQLLEVLAAAHETASTVAYFQRTAALAHLIAGNTHELRNSATYSARYLEYIRQDLAALATELPPDQADRLSRMIDDAGKIKKHGSSGGSARRRPICRHRLIRPTRTWSRGSPGSSA